MQVFDHPSEIDNVCRTMDIYWLRIEQAIFYAQA